MTTVHKLVGSLILIALVTTMVLPDRNTPAAINLTGNVVGGLLGTIMGKAS